MLNIHDLFRKSHHRLLLALSFVLSSCTRGPDYHQPDVRAAQAATRSVVHAQHAFQEDRGRPDLGTNQNTGPDRMGRFE